MSDVAGRLSDDPFYDGLRHRCIDNDTSYITQSIGSVSSIQGISNPGQPALDMAVPPYQYIVAAERLKILIAIREYKSGRANQAMELLYKQFSILRNAMRLQDTLIGKLIYLMKLSEILDVASIIATQAKLTVDRIAPLSQNEKSFHLIAAHEFLLAINSSNHLHQHPDILSQHNAITAWLLMQLFYKQNMTMNDVVLVYQQLEEIVQYSPAKFA